MSIIISKKKIIFHSTKSHFPVVLDGKNGFAERSKILVEYRSVKVILLNYQNNYVELVVKI